MRTILIICTALFLNTAFAQQDVLIWNDEFDVDGAPNSAKWGYDLGNNGGWGNNELEVYTNASANVRVAGGLLIIDAIKSGTSWTSARIKSQNKFNFTYGRVKFRAKLPTGTGTWPALWMLAESVTTKGWPACGEIDVMEHVGKTPGTIHSALHTTSSNGNTVNTKTTMVSTFSTEFHEYEVYWTPEKIQFSVDATPFYTYQPSPKTEANFPFNTPFFLIMNLAIGGNFGGPVDASLTAAELQVDYVRVYQAFNQFNIIGPDVVQPNQTGVAYEFQNFSGATYTWSVPAGATIATGNGTNKIFVNWGEAEGDVTLSIALTDTYQTSLSVKQTVKPPGTSMALPAQNFWKKNTDNINLYDMTSSSPMRIDYTVARKVFLPALIGTFDRALDLSDHPVLKVKIKTHNTSGTVNLRMDLVDAAGVATVRSPVFDFTPLIDDGEFYKYTFDFQKENLWASTSGPVDKRRISKINFYIDYGTAAITGYDSIWVDTLWVEQSPLLGTSLPNRPSHLSATRGGSIAFQWQDNSDNETEFEVLKSSSRDGIFTAAGTSTANMTTLTVPGSAGITFYKVRSLNNVGYSEGSNIISSEEIITGLPHSEMGEIKIYPNPTYDHINVELPTGGATFQLFDLLGRELLNVQSKDKTSKLDLSRFSKGYYFIHIRARNGSAIEKVVLQ